MRASRTLFYGAYANRTRGAKGSREPYPPPAPRFKRCTPSWARLIAKVNGADPLICRRCGGKLRIIAYITDSLAIKQRSAPSPWMTRVARSARPADPPRTSSCRPFYTPGTFAMCSRLDKPGEPGASRGHKG
jgi:hypothetical protein